MPAFQESIHRLSRFVRLIRAPEGFDAGGDGGLKVGVPPANDELLLKAYGLGAALQDFTDKALGGGPEVRRLDNAVHQTPIKGFLGADALPGEQQFCSPSRPDDARQQRGMDHGWDANPDLRQAELC